MNNKKLITVKGERNSGTNWLRSLIKQNSHNIKYIEDSASKNNYGSKHAFVSEFNKYHINNDNINVIIVLRDVFYWLVSMYKKSYVKELDNLIKNNNLTFSDFIRHEYNYKYFSKGDIESADNIVDLRKKKIKNLLEVDINNKFFVNYDNTNDDLYNILKKINVLNDNWINNDNYTKYKKVKNYKFIKKKKMEIMEHYTKEDIRFILNNIDTKQEEKLGLSYEYVKSYL